MNPGTFVWAGLAVVLWIFRVREARARYVLSVLGMVALAMCPLATLAELKVSPAGHVGVDARPVRSDSTATDGAKAVCVRNPRFCLNDGRSKDGSASAYPLHHRLIG